MKQAYSISEEKLSTGKVLGAADSNSRPRLYAMDSPVWLPVNYKGD